MLSYIYQPITRKRKTL